MKFPIQIGFLAAIAAVPIATADWNNCKTDEECEGLFRDGSKCVEGVCQNPFYYGGCLKSMLPEWDKVRVCSSDDPPEAQALGYCRPSPMGYAEIRLPAKNWHTANFLAWILQVLLGEMLDVPVSIETGSPGHTMGLYDLDPGFEYWNNIISTDYQELTTAYKYKDCQLANKSPENYESCCHFMPEIWYYGDPQNVGEGIEPVRELGAMAENHWFIPRFAVDEEPSLATWIGLSGEVNRHKVAETFKRPTRWQDYCNDISPTNCAEPDGVAERAPMDEDEAKSFFVENLYTGHFRVTDAGNCTKNPTTCTGHYINFDCGWPSMAAQQSYHLDIPVAFEGPEPNGGYPYAETIQIMAASTATRSPIVAFWYTPEPGVESRIGTEFEFIRVLFPTPTKECVDNVADFRYACDATATFEQKVGNALGACDTYPLALSKAYSLALKEIAEDPDVITEFHSPAYDVLNSFKIGTLQFGVLFKYWDERGDDKFHFGSRDAACRWAAENIDTLRSFVPQSHPRTVREVDTFSEPLFRAATVIAYITVVVVLFAIMLAFRKRKTKVIYYTQIEYLILILAGLLLTATGSVLYSVFPTDLNCAVRPFLTNLGHLLQVLPMCVRIAAINNLATSGKHMHRIRLDVFKLYAIVGAAAALLSTFLLLWVILDTPQNVNAYEMTASLSDSGETIIEATHYCGSEYDFWFYIDMAWLGMVLVPVCMVSFMTRRVKEDMNDTKSLSNALFVYLFFLVLMAVAYALLFDESKPSLMGYSSLILSFNSMAVVATYILPKFWDSGENLESEPLPDVFVHTTVALIKIDGFTAWTSVREPVQVFQFLEELYEQFDHEAVRHNVYKVETVGECYICATGVPKPQHDHAVLLAKFSLTLMKKMSRYLKSRMEVKYGPDTADLSLRIGLHSGPVTGGFLRGKGSRFQLFGAHVNTAHVILDNGSSGRIHLSEQTANLLIKAGKSNWITQREDNVYNIEVGKLQTWWLSKNDAHGDDVEADLSKNMSLDEDATHTDDVGSEERWVEWNVGVFTDLLKQIIAKNSFMIQQNRNTAAPVLELADMPLNEVKEVIYLPDFDKKAARRLREHEDVEIPHKVVQELKEFISEVSARYNDNPFHNFAHASYVVMAITKYMKRVVAAQELGLNDKDERFRSSVQATLHDHTYGIVSDPLTLFACAFSALIHDVDHPGVPNNQLIKENEQVATKYQGRSVAEQRSLDIAWDLFMEDRFKELRSVICHNNREELQRFRQLCVNSIMATDLGDKQLKELRNSRWERAFANADCTSRSGMSSTASYMPDSGDTSVKQRQKETINRKATIVIEHLIQASDVAHMSQHWTIYRKWNERLFREVYKAWREGRADSNPADNWYKGEIGFFDFYIIPLSAKLRDCGVFGPTSDENINYATNNRNMWVKEGEAIVKDMLERVEHEYNHRLVALPEQPQPDRFLEVAGERVPAEFSV